jgi:hypothetical protein
LASTPYLIGHEEVLKVSLDGARRYAEASPDFLAAQSIPK